MLLYLLDLFLMIKINTILKYIQENACISRHNNRKKYNIFFFIFNILMGDTTVSKSNINEKMKECYHKNKEKEK